LKAQFEKQDFATIDRKIGERIKLARRQADLTQKQVGNAIGTSYQHIQKYEKGMHSIQASKLMALAALFEVPVGYFFESVNDFLVKQGETESYGAPLLLQESVQKIHLIKLICRAGGNDVEALTLLARHMIRKQPVEESRANLSSLPRRVAS